MEELIAAGCPGNRDDLSKLAVWLAEQEVTELDDLRGAGDLTSLAGAPAHAFGHIGANILRA